MSSTVAGGEGAGALPAGTGVGAVSLRVADLERALEFYGGVLGLEPARSGPGAAELTAPGAADPPLLRLREHPGAVPRPRRSTGLFHLALLVPDRAALGRVFLGLSERRWPLQGASDHRVSEALYLTDPDGNGLEIYADRPREAWPWKDGELAMATDPLDLRGLLAEVPPGEGGAGLPPGTTVGHIHLQVADLAAAEAFYVGHIGFDVTTRAYPGALFLSAGGYHHHVGLNTWAGRGAPPPPEDAAGLLGWEIIVPDASVRERMRRSLAGEEESPDSFQVHDPDGVPVRIRG